MQSTFRGYYTRKQVNMYKEHRRHYSAYRVQHFYRMFAERREARAELERRRAVRRVDNAAKSVTRAARNHLGRKQAAPIVEARRQQLAREREEVEAEMAEEAATRIQAIQRGRLARQRVSELEAARRREAVLELQEAQLRAKVDGEVAAVV